MMNNEIKIEFGSGKKLSAVSDDYCIDVDMPVNEGGEGSAPEPTHLFLASLATCAAHYARKFCEARSLPMEGLGLKVRYQYNEEGDQIAKFTYELSIPEGFPEKYKAALLRALDLCPIKKLLMSPPSFQLEIV
ncbi:OsmC family protein [Maridesulfovibrio sp.]|uniref:OsmC family protein n=1 Tax=Maridesulfovibrio sp. TaxID=2795000 RepID=UPI002A18A7CB|nr:OsmC family protein [Maridesulfovibrio sp.]